MAPSPSTHYSPMVLTPGWLSVGSGWMEQQQVGVAGRFHWCFVQEVEDSWDAESGGPARSDQDTHGSVLLHPSRFHGSHPWVAERTVGSGGCSTSRSLRGGSSGDVLYMRLRVRGSRKEVGHQVYVAREILLVFCTGGGGLVRTRKRSSRPAESERSSRPAESERSGRHWPRPPPLFLVPWSSPPGG